MPGVKIKRLQNKKQTSKLNLGKYSTCSICTAHGYFPPLPVCNGGEPNEKRQEPAWVHDGCELIRVFRHFPKVVNATACRHRTSEKPESDEWGVERRVKSSLKASVMANDWGQSQDKLSWTTAFKFCWASSRPLVGCERFLAAIFLGGWCAGCGKYTAGWQETSEFITTAGSYKCTRLMIQHPGRGTCTCFSDLEFYPWRLSGGASHDQLSFNGKMQLRQQRLLLQTLQTHTFRETEKQEWLREDRQQRAVLFGMGSVPQVLQSNNAK